MPKILITVLGIRAVVVRIPMMITNLMPLPRANLFNGN